MREQSKATKRRKNDWRFGELWLTGAGIDIGCGNDPISKEDWAKISEVTQWDRDFGDGDAQYMSAAQDGKFDFVHASHVLEHLQDPKVSLMSWARILKPGGHIVCTVPDEVLYESGIWPSRFNPDHKVPFTLRATPAINYSINILWLLWKVGLDVEKVELIRDGWKPELIGRDQTLEGAECAIEFVARKPRQDKPW